MLSQLVQDSNEIKRLHPCFGVQQSNGTSADTLRPNRKWVIQDGGLKTYNANSPRSTGIYPVGILCDQTGTPAVFIPGMHAPMGWNPCQHL